MKQKFDYWSLYVGILIGIMIGTLFFVFSFITNFGGIATNNGLMFQKDCHNDTYNLNPEINNKNLTIWCIDRLKECTNEEFKLIDMLK